MYSDISRLVNSRSKFSLPTRGELHPRSRCYCDSSHCEEFSFAIGTLFLSSSQSNNSLLTIIWNRCCTKSCKKCPLFADTSADDKTRIRSAAETVATKVENKVKVDVNAMLKDPPVAAPQRQNPPKGRARPPTPVRRQRQPVRGGGMPPPPGSPPAPGRPLMQQPPQQGGQF